MKKFLLLCSGLAAFFANSQQIKLSLSDEFNFRTDGNYCKMGNNFFRLDMDISGARIAKLSKFSHAITIYKYDKLMNEVKKNELENGKNNFGPFYSRLVNFDDVLILIYYKYPDEQTVKLYVSKVDPESLTLIETKEILNFTQENISAAKVFNTSSNDNRLLFAIVSPDKSRLLILHSNTKQITSCVIDKNLNMTGNSSLTSPDVKEFEAQYIFLDNSGNKYLSYKYTENKELRHGILMQNSSGKESFQDFNLGNVEYKANDINFKNSKDNSKVFAYANYFGNYLNEGIVITSLDATNLKIVKPTLIPYPDDFKERIAKTDFGVKSKGNYSVCQINYHFEELENGLINLTGEPEINSTYYSASFGGALPSNSAGPIVSIFINGDKKIFSLIPRKQTLNESSGCIVIPYKDRVVCFYSDREENLEKGLEDKFKFASIPTFLVLAVAIINPDGTIASRKKIGDSSKYFYFTSNIISISNNYFLIPVGFTKNTLNRNDKEIVQWASVEIK